MQRLSAPERTREEVRALMNGELGTAEGRSALVRLALRLIVEEALEGEVSDAPGRERYERGEGDKSGYRNGYRTGKVKTAEGAVEYSAPQVRDTPEPFVSSVRAALSGRTRELERLAVELYARGLSTRDIEDAFTDETGRRLLSRARSPSGCGPNTRTSARAIFPSTASSTCSSTASPSGFDRVSGARRCWRPGALARTDARSCSD
jgi:hypothetical protein